MPEILLSPESRLCRNLELFASEVDDELVMLDESQGLYFALNPVGRTIWETLARPADFASLLDALSRLYEVTPEQCRSDVEPFLKRMIALKLIRVGDL
jgi:hypothetical protein